MHAFLYIADSIDTYVPSYHPNEEGVYHVSFLYIAASTDTFIPS